MEIDDEIIEEVEHCKYASESNIISWKYDGGKIRNKYNSRKAFWAQKMILKSEIK